MRLPTAHPDAVRHLRGALCHEHPSGFGPAVSSHQLPPYLPEVPLIMVVEDNKINQRLLRDIIRVQGWRSVEADDADMAEEILRMLKVRGEVPDMAMVDIRLPDRSGCDLVRSLKANDNWKAMPVIAVTAMAGRANAQRILEAGCDDYIAKPISVAHIIETVHKYLG